MKVAIASYLASIPDGAAKSDGVKLGEAVAAKVLEERANDGADAPDAYRPRTTPGVYVPMSVLLCLCRASPYRHFVFVSLRMSFRAATYPRT